MPAYKELTGLKTFVPEIQQAFASHNFTIIIIDDASGDGTHNYFSNSKSEVRVIENQLNLGHGPSLTRGLNASLELNPTHVMSVDGDGQFLGSEMLAFWEGFLDSKSHLGEAVRIRNSEPYFRRLTSKITRSLVYVKSGTSTNDANTPLRVYEVKVLEKLLIDLKQYSGIRSNPKGLLTPNLLASIWVRKNKLLIYERNVEFLERRGDSNKSVSWRQKFNMLPSKKFLKFCFRAFVEVVTY